MPTKAPGLETGSLFALEHRNGRPYPDVGGTTEIRMMRKAYLGLSDNQRDVAMYFAFLGSSLPVMLVLSVWHF